jgi:hypothetical protein
MEKQIVKRCYKQDILVPRIERALRVKLGKVNCRIVDRKGMVNVMRRSGWNSSDAQGVVGFQVRQDVFVLDDAPWSTLHELVHRAGINADRMNRFVAEGLTENIASSLSQGKDEHRATYPQESSWVQKKLLPATGMNAIQLGRVLANSKEPSKTLAKILVKRNPKLNYTKVLSQLRPRKEGAPSLNRGAGKMTRTGSDAPQWSETGWTIGLVLIVAGLGVAIPSYFAKKGV